MKDKVVIVDAKRTAIGKYRGSLSEFNGVDLGRIVTTELLNGQRNLLSQRVNFIFGNVFSAGQGQNIARQIALKSGAAISSTAMTVNQVCGSGMKAIHLGEMTILSNQADVVLVGGTESMSNVPFYNKEFRSNKSLKTDDMIDGLQVDGLIDSDSGELMGITAEYLAEKFAISRQAQDLFSYDSHKKATRARNLGYFQEEIVPIKLRNGKYFSIDEGIREQTSIEKLAQLKPVFQESGTVTAGNAASLNDGAAALLLMSKSKAEREGIPYLATIDGYVEVGVNPKEMGYAPKIAIDQLLNNLGEKLDDIDLFEINEAFASQTLAVKNALGISSNQLNISGGALALGHPLGASGSRIVTTLLFNLKRASKKNGIASICVGGGMGMALRVTMNEQ
jgi:acetyl-CoA C-acetyltransferase